MQPLPNLIPASGTDLVPGALKPLRVAAPAPGAVSQVVIEGGTLGQIPTASVQFTASAVVANRGPGITITDPDDNTIFEDNVQGTVTASQVARITFGTLVSMNTLPTQQRYTVPIPAMWLPAGYKIKLFVLNIDAGDQFAVINGLLAELDPSVLYPAGNPGEWVGEPEYRHWRSHHAQG